MMCPGKRSLVALFLFAALVSISFAQEVTNQDVAQSAATPATQPQTPPTPEPLSTEPADTGAPDNIEAEPDIPIADAKDDRPNPCKDEIELTAWIDKLHSRLYRLTCSSSSWFDGLFGDGRYDDEYRQTHGSVIVGGRWSQYDDFSKTLKFKARVQLPQLNEKFHAFIGRDDRQDFITESQSRLYELPDRFNSTNRNFEDSVFLGLGYSDRMHTRGTFDTDAGVRLSFPMDPYAKARYRFARPFGEVTLMRIRETVFWQKSERWGTTTVMEWDRILSKKYLARWTGSGTYSQNTDGLRWFSNVTLYHLMGNERAFAYEVAANGNTDSDIPLSDYGASVIYRQRIWREWLLMEVRTGLDWPRYRLDEERHSNINVALTFELRYGRQ